ncbi:helix-turn-helix transcriptional regulator [Bacillus sp. CLL-7-23]|uniref:Helix-turn-helix transcriptional regulator n=1 Tax=Bacillus changyiensis TaxID=3004103 RepID=A0ABT4X8M7_9BACI|nr:helix-turn-helix transcriptional regulator [Bacillus changyiensis]MDA7028652.1 helix-turn-helix transcriptional regulator [Bacillus changyiensis]
MLGDRLRELRESRKLTQDKLAEVLGISRGTYAHYEINKRKPDYDTLIQIAEFFEVTVDYLLGKPKSESVVKEEKASYEIDDPDLQIAFKDATDFSEEARQQAIDFIKFLKEKEKRHGRGNK